MLRVLVISRVFPNTLEPLSSPFARQQIARLSARCEVEVVSPLPWFPGAGLLGERARAGRLERAAREATFDGVHATFVRGAYVPVVGLGVAVPLLVASLARTVARRRGRVDVVLGTWLYPDACAAVLLGRMLSVPTVVKAHGTDVNEIAQRRDVAPIVRAVLPLAAAAVAPSRPLVAALTALGAREAEVVPNGVDTRLFYPQSRHEARVALGLDPAAPIVLFVGRLDPKKGVRELCAAARELAPGARVLLVGDGPLRAEVGELSAGRAEALGPRPLGEVARWLAACDVLALPSYAEGMPNVVLEAHACGRPVVATDVGGIPDVVEPGLSGTLVAPRDASALAAALVGALARPWDERAIAASGPPSWDESAARLEAVLRRAVAGAPRGQA